eukprot:6475142-Amphidinium_carterae.1
MFGQAEPKESFDDIFKDLEPQDVYRQRPPREEYINVLADTPGMAIINAPGKSLEVPLITFNASFWAERAKEVMADRQDFRSKKVLATLRGVGGGKTRALEEMRWELLGEDVLPLAITYNSGMNFTPAAEFSWSTKYEVCYALGVVARLASVLYGQAPERMMQKLTDRSTTWGLDMDYSYPTKLIRGFLQHAIQKVKAVRSDISGVIVLVDEVIKAESAFADAYKLDSAAKRDVTGILRSALLDEKFVEVHVGLVVSTLALSAAGHTTSDRFVMALILSNLEPEKILSNWWKRHEKCLLALASALSSLPRAVEIVA